MDKKYKLGTKENTVIIGCGVVCILFLVLVWYYIWPYQGLRYKYQNEYPIVKEHAMIELTEGKTVTQTFSSENIHLKGIELYLIHNQEMAEGTLKISILDETGRLQYNWDIPFSEIPNAEWHFNFFDLTLKKDRIYQLQYQAEGLNGDIPQFVMIPKSDGNIQNQKCFVEQEVQDGVLFLSYDFAIMESSYVKTAIFVFIAIIVVTLFLLVLNKYQDNRVYKLLYICSSKMATYKGIFVVAAMIVQFIIMIPNIVYKLDGINLDPSWRWFLNIANEEGLKYGTDIYFTYGPLGYICYLMKLDSNATYWLGIGIWAVLFFIHIVLMVWLYKKYKEKKVSFVAIMLSVICYLAVFAEPERDNYQLYLLILSVVIYYLGNKKSIIISNVMLCLMFFCKFSTFTSGVAFITIFVIFHYLFTKDKFGFLLMLPSFVIAPIAYFIYNPSLKGLYEYVTGILRISSGWMQTQQWNDAFTKNEYISMLFIIILYVLMLFIVLKTDYRKSSILLACSASLFFAYKYGVTAHGIAMSIWLTGLLFSVVMLSLDFDLIYQGIGKKKGYSLCYMGLVVCCVGITMLQALNLHNNFGQLKDSLKNKVTTFLSLNDSSLLPELYENTYIPEAILSEIGNDTVTVYPWEVAYKAVYPQLNMVYSPSIQNCNEFIPWLDQKVADYFYTDQAPNYIILEDETIYFHINYLENPLTYEALKANYNVEMTQEGFCLLKKSTNIEEKELKFLFKEEYDVTDKINCPAEADYIKIQVKTTLLGKLKDFFWRAGMTDMHIQYLDGSSESGVIIVPNLTSGFSLEYVPQSIEDVANVFNEEDVTKMSEIQLGGIGTDVLDDKMIVEWYCYE